MRPDVDDNGCFAGGAPADLRTNLSAAAIDLHRVFREQLKVDIAIDSFATVASTAKLAVQKAEAEGRNVKDFGCG